MLHSVSVDKDENVFVFFLDEKLGVTLRLTPDEAIKIGEIGNMARLRKQVTEQSVLDDADFESELKDMKIGESGWTVSWALEADEKNRPYLRLFHTYMNSPHGTAQMLVQRLDKNYWQVQLPSGHKFHGKTNPNPAWEVSYHLNIV